METIAIILAAYNGGAYLEEQLASIAASTYKNWVLYIFDDGSKDNTEWYARKFVQQHPDKAFYSKNPDNLGSTRNFLQGIQTVRRQKRSPDYYMFCDQDDVWKPDKIARSMHRMKQMEKVYGKDTPLLCFTDAEVTDAQLHTTAASLMTQQKLNYKALSLAGLLMENKAIGCTMLLNRPLTGYLGTLPKYCRYHDWWVCLLGAAFGRVSFIPHSTLLYRQHDHNVVGSRAFTAYVMERVEALRKQKEILRATYRQAESLLDLYGAALTEENRTVVEQFVRLSAEGKLTRIALCIRYGFLKSGILRNIGLLLII